MRHRVLLGCLVLSGFSGLAYELLWTRLLSLTFGSTTLSFSTVVAVFFGGLALGAWGAGRVLIRIRRPIQAYVVIELLTGLFGLVLYPIMTRLGVVFVSFDPGPGLGGAILRLLVTAPLLLVPTVLMGATLPFVCAAMIHRDDESTRGMALIYGFNTLGAFLGAYSITYHLIPELGVFRSHLVAIFFNWVAGAIAWVAERRAPSGRRVNGAKPSLPIAEPAVLVREEVDPARRHVALVAPALTFLLGFAFICLEVVWARLFSALLAGTIYGVGAVLICFLIGIAAGSLFLANRISPRSDLGLWFASLQAVGLAWIWLAFAQLPRIANVLINLGVEVDGTLRSQHYQLLVVLVALLVPTAASGASFPLLVKIVETRALRTGQALGRIYAANTVGSILGSLAAGFVLIPELGSVGSVLLAMAVLALVAAVSGVVLVGPTGRWAGRGVAIVALLVVAFFQDFEIRLIAAGAPANVPKQHYDDYVRRYRDTAARLIYFAEARDGTVSVTESGLTRSLSINGLGQGSRSRVPPYHLLESTLVGLVPLIHVEEPANALLVGLGAGITIERLNELGVPRIEVAEIERRVLDAVEAIHLGDNPLDREGVEVTIDDARHRLLAGAREGEERFDIIASMPAHPWIASSLFTREFFELAKANLSSKGVFATWFGIWKMDGPAVESLFRAFCSVFEHYVIYFVPETSSYYLVGAENPLSIDPERIETLSGHPTFAEEYLLNDPMFLPTRVYATGNDETPPPPEGVINTDDNAFVEIHAPRSGSKPAKLSSFLPREYLLPAMVPADRRREFLIELMERLLGTPGGRFPDAESYTEPERAERTLAASKELLTSEDALYFRGRIAIAAGRTEEARAMLAKARSGRGELAGRAAKFEALSHDQGSPERLDSLIALEPAADVLMVLLDEEGERALELVPRRPVDPEEDPIGWFLWKAATTPQGSLGEPDLSIFLYRVAPRLGRTIRLGLLRAAEDFCREQGLLTEAEAFNVHRRAITSARVNRLVREGTSAGRQGRFAEAADAFWRANELEPGSERIMHPLLRSLVETRDEQRLAVLLNQFRFLGDSERRIQALLRVARDGALSFPAFEPEKEPGEDSLTSAAAQGASGDPIP